MKLQMLRAGLNSPPGHTWSPGHSLPPSGLTGSVLKHKTSVVESRSSFSFPGMEKKKDVLLTNRESLKTLGKTAESGGGPGRRRPSAPQAVTGLANQERAEAGSQTPARSSAGPRVTQKIGGLGGGGGGLPWQQSCDVRRPPPIPEQKNHYRHSGTTKTVRQNKTDRRRETSREGRCPVPDVPDPPLKPGFS